VVVRLACLKYYSGIIVRRIGLPLLLSLKNLDIRLSEKSQATYSQSRKNESSHNPLTTIKLAKKHAKSFCVIHTKLIACCTKSQE